jgi:hypothetical protein
VLAVLLVAAQAASASAAPVSAPAFLWAPKSYGWVTRRAYLSRPHLEISTCSDACVMLVSGLPGCSASSSGKWKAIVHRCTSIDAMTHVFFVSLFSK